ncbi:hypothetical protein GCM10027035_23480 [Emticicia sediminis]
MTQEEQNIKHKIENLSEGEFADLDMDFDDTDLWNRLEGRLDDKKPRKQKPLWLWWVAASLLLGVFFFVDFKESESNIQAMVSPKKNSVKLREELRVTPWSKKNKQKIIQKEAITNIPLVEKPAEEQKKLNIKLEPLLSKSNFDSLTYNKKTIAYEPKFKVQQVTIVDFPVIPDELMKRESFAKRAFRQLKSFNTEGKIDWRELNIEPRNVWAYLERSFKYDTTSIQNKKNIKQ